MAESAEAAVAEAAAVEAAVAEAAAVEADAVVAGTAGTAAAATGAFDSLAGTRPRIRQDVLFTETPGGVLFHNADGGFHLTGRTAYRFASLVVPHLTGHHRLDELCAGFGPGRRAMAAELVKTLYAREFARDIPVADSTAEPLPDAVAERFAAQIAYVDHYADGAPERFARFRATRVAVLGDDEVARWCALSLIRNGCVRIGTATGFDDVTAEAAGAGAYAERIGSGADAGFVASGADAGRGSSGTDAGWAALGGYDVVVVTGAGAGARTQRLLAAGVPEGRTLIPAWSFGRRLVVGPLATATSTGCWSCAVLRLGGNVAPGPAAELWGEAAGAVTSSADTLSGPVAAMVGNLLGYEIFRIATGALPAETDGQVLVQDLESLDVMAEPVQPHPRCRRCADLDAREPAAALPEGLALPVTPTVETARDAEALVEDLNRISTALVRPFTGIFGRYDDEGLTQTPLKISRVEVALGAGVRRRIAAFDVHHLAGARMRALYAAAEVYVEHVVPVAAEDDADAVAGEGAAVPVLAPDALTTGGGTGARPRSWVTATSLIRKEPVRVPAAAVRTFGAHNRDRPHLATSAGSGAGGSAREAAGRGLMSALAHDALLRAVRGATRVSPVAVDGADPELVFLLKSAANLDVAVELLDLGEGARTSAHVVLAREANTGVTGGRWAVGSGLSRRAAACSALRDLLGQVQLAAEDPGAEVDLGDPLLGDFAAGTVAVTGESVAADGAATTFEAVLDRLRDAGRDALYVPTTPADLPAGGISTARVLLTVDGEVGPDAR
ncbi:TOMM precursor leader peptide-binding protein [Streptomyces sp. NBC_01433]|uniref:TOMM precursor leader peptide-binding protein n=1 Tax=Streptomyces sp. NBC_01433 TaxID=2903864 RepID=UPI0022594555|nr:TOMM precursor leader peptide-binding protein [Streptomyces sp. NBC_01433]MCX4676635.1 TOMM precursor leader peptide-binding protein [Streptomyces sp. NBC_01433]